MTEVKRITISGVLEDLENGMTRPQIQEKYELSGRELKTLFSNPKLKGKKAKSIFVPSFELVDDVDETEDSQTQEEVAEEQNLFTDRN